MEAARNLGRGQRSTKLVHALKNISFDVEQGEVLGIVGANGAGKSTLMRAIGGIVPPDAGEIKVKGEISALLALGVGFNPLLSGRENVVLAGLASGLSRERVEEQYQSIVEFSGIREFIDQPVKTYSSGMYVRLAFSIATSANPDILVIDEALSVGDGAFAKKSFERIMQLKAQGTTVLFCSHSMYQVESFCDRALWLDHGQVQMEGPAAKVVAAYADSLREESKSSSSATLASVRASGGASTASDASDVSKAASAAALGVARITNIEVSVDGQTGRELEAVSLQSDVSITVQFESDPALPCPTFATGFALPDGQIFTSAYTLFDGIAIERDAQGRGQATVVFEKLPLMKGRFSIGAYLFDERALHVYDMVLQAATVMVTQAGVHQGFVQLPHRWK
jgi:lipopolysaccharide transport system ATP-binding protein